MIGVQLFFYDDNGNINYETVNNVKNVYNYAKLDADVRCGYDLEKPVGENINLFLYQHAKPTNCNYRY